MNNNVLITGISGGIGNGLARKILASGGTVIGVDKVLSDDIRQLEEQNEGLSLYDADLMETKTIPDLIKQIVEKHGSLGGFVHCAGFDKMAPLHLAKQEDIETLWKVHALVPMLIISSISKKKNHTENTGIVLISSQSAHEGAMGHTAYAAAKGAIEGYLAPAAAELMEKGIRINEVCFAPIKTAMAASWMNLLTDEGKQKLMDSYPLGIGEIEDAVNLIYFLLSNESKWINGQIITADGGHAVRKV